MASALTSGKAEPTCVSQLPRSATASGARPYTSTRTGETDVYIHPSSTLFREAPTMVVFQELVETSLPYMKGALAIPRRT